MKKLITIVLIVLAMYTTAKWPDQVIFVTEFGYQVGKGLVTVVIDTIKGDENEESEIVM